MKKLIVEEWLSLDGFAVDKDGKLDFFPASETDKFSDLDQLEFLKTVDTWVGMTAATRQSPTDA